MVLKIIVSLIGLAWLAREIHEWWESLQPVQPPPLRPMRIEGIDASEEEVRNLWRNWKCPNPNANFRHTQEKFAEQFGIIPADLHDRYTRERAYEHERATRKVFRDALGARIYDLCMNANRAAQVKRAAVLEDREQEALAYRVSLNAVRARPASVAGSSGSSIDNLSVHCVTSPTTNACQAIVPVPPKPLLKPNSPATPAAISEGREERHEPCLRIRVMSLIKEVWFTA
jgi:hypothetical protein